MSILEIEFSCQDVEMRLVVYQFGIRLIIRLAGMAAPWRGTASGLLKSFLQLSQYKRRRKIQYKKRQKVPEHKKQHKKTFMTIIYMYFHDHHTDHYCFHGALTSYQ